MDVAGPTWLGTQHTDRVRRAAQEEAARRCRELEFRVTPQAPLPPRFRLVVFAVSTFGSFGSEAQRFLAEVGRRCGTALPVSLLPHATWAAPTLAPFARMAVAFAVRRGLAERVFERWRPAAGPGGAGEAEGVPPWEEVDDEAEEPGDADEEEEEPGDADEGEREEPEDADGAQLDDGLG